MIAKTKPSIAAALSRSQVVSDSPQAFRVALRENDYTANLVKKNLALIEAVCREHAGKGILIDLANEDADETPAEQIKAKAKEVRQQLLNHPLVADAVDIFSGKIETIKIK